MTTLDTVRHARALGFTRHDILKLGVAAGGMLLAACGGDDPGDVPINKLAVGTGKINTTSNHEGNATQDAYTDVQDFEITINNDGTSTATDNPYIHRSGTWQWASGQLQVTAQFTPAAQ